MNTKFTVETSNERETINTGERLGRILGKGDIVCLYGDLGAGKTTFVKGIARGLGIEEREITSASFVIIAEHYGRIPLYHIDLYRVSGGDDVQDLGLEEYLDGEGVAVVEWAERLTGWDCSFRVDIKFLDDVRREITISGSRERIEALECGFSGFKEEL
ncbi:MAG: tRNA (adenosine(37)-N6)-threonylcarbamoyltransferase complex ATPase subunit type 1 TsaE [Nitrospirota bacterium]|nr:tRNA (adenosine(37)-N6)-threonylcarbamoyltransferase complex ATPase subunit type 1 TsaE [Nitrospirota bacterium]